MELVLGSNFWLKRFRTDGRPYPDIPGTSCTTLGTLPKSQVGWALLSYPYQKKSRVGFVLLSYPYPNPEKVGYHARYPAQTTHTLSNMTLETFSDRRVVIPRYYGKVCSYLARTVLVTF